MSGSNWFFPPAIINSLPNTDARTQSITPYGANSIAIGGFASSANNASLFSLNLGTGVWSVIGPTYTASQYVDTAPSSGAGVIAIDDYGNFLSAGSGGAVVASNVLTTASGAFLSLYEIIGGSPFGVSCEGTIFNAMTGAHAGSFFSSGGGPLTQSLAVSGGGAKGLITASNEIGVVTNSGTYSSTVAGPSGPSGLTCFANSSAHIGVGGTAVATQGASGQNFFVQNPENTSLLMGVSNTIATVFDQLAPGSPMWNPATQLTGITGAAKFGVWSTNGTQALLSDGTNGHLQILNYITGTLSIAQTLTLANIGQIAAANDGIYALACIPNEVAVFESSGSTWSQNGSNTLSVSGASCILPFTGDIVLVGAAAGVSLLEQNAGTWSVSGTLATPFQVTAVAIDQSSNIYAAGAGTLQVFNSSGEEIGSGTFPGSGAAAMIVTQAQVLILDTITAEFYILASRNQVNWFSQTTYPSNGATSICEAGASIFFGGSPPYIMNWSAPYALVNVADGYAGVYNGTSWTSVSLGAGKVPSAAAFDASNNLWLACNDNSLYEISSAGSILSQTAVPNYPGTNTPLGVSSLAFVGADLYAGCSMFGGLVKVF